MTTETFNLFFSLLSVAAAAIAVGIPVVALAARRAPHGAAATFLDELRPLALWLAFLVAAVATLGSLYYSEVAHFTPCEFCWYQRIAMYPLSVVLGIAAVRGDVGIRRYVLPLAAIGAALSTYHYYIERFPSAGGACDPLVPCTVPWFEQWGFLTLALMALTGFLAIIALLSVAGTGHGPTTPAHEDEDIST